MGLTCGWSIFTLLSNSGGLFGTTDCDIEEQFILPVEANALCLAETLQQAKPQTVC
jgi:hypothetical protein